MFDSINVFSVLGDGDRDGEGEGNLDDMCRGMGLDGFL